MNDINKIYVLCPANVVTGGPDALHQIVLYLNNIGIAASIVYFGEKKENIKIPIPYRCYITDFLVLNDMTFTTNDIIISPESYFYVVKNIKCKKIIWWLSVDNNAKYTFFYKLFAIATIPLRYLKNNILLHRNINYLKYIKHVSLIKKINFTKEDDILFHICASYYAYNYVSKKSSICTYKAIEPISKIFLKKYNANINYKTNKENVILYNPVKCYSIIKKIIKHDKKHKYIPLSGMNQDELIEMYKKAKLYIDFGPFPGAERMPKEAVLFDCCIITGRRGASNYYGDVPILDKYKFNNYKEYDKIISMIDYIFENYEIAIKDFKIYKDVVLSLENNFIESLKNIFYEGKSKI
ncbi:MAG: hypothetical protein V8R16_02470 [Bacilli bacterium]